MCLCRNNVLVDLKKINKYKIHKHTMLVNIVIVRYCFLPKAQSRGEAPQGIFCEMYLGELTRILQTPGCYFCSLKLSVTCLINFALTGCTQRISCSGTHRGKNKTKQHKTTTSLFPPLLVVQLASSAFRPRIGCLADWSCWLKPACPHSLSWKSKYKYKLRCYCCSIERSIRPVVIHLSVHLFI